MLLVASVAITVLLAALRGRAVSYQVMLALVVVHGVFWSGLLSSSSAYVIDICPASRRAEGLGYSGFASILARGGGAVDRAVGVRSRRLDGCCASRRRSLNLLMAVIAWRLPPDTRHAARPTRRCGSRDLVEWRVLVLAAVTLFLYAFSYGGITSFVAVYAEQHRRDAARAVLHGLLRWPSSAPGRSSAATPIASATAG